MADIVTKEKRSEMMAGIRSSDTHPELLIRKALFRQGYRYRLHVKSLPGKPDLYFPKLNAVVLVNGCFWHGHPCHLFKLPSSREDFWREKIAKNRINDAKVLSRFSDLGVRTAVVWECAIKGKAKIPLEQIIIRLSEWLKGNSMQLEISSDK